MGLEKLIYFFVLNTCSNLSGTDGADLWRLSFPRFSRLQAYSYVKSVPIKE